MVSTDPHIVSNMASEDVATVHLSIQLLAILLEASKSLFTVWDVNTPIQGSLQFR
jgi:hypothetical protein